jgi:hypothetical protein
VGLLTKSIVTFILASFMGMLWPNTSSAEGRTSSAPLDPTIFPSMGTQSLLQLDSAQDRLIFDDQINKPFGRKRNSSTILSGRTCKAPLISLPISSQTEKNRSESKMIDSDNAELIPR